MMSAKKWAFSFVALILVCLLVIMSLNYFVDPYGYFRSQSGEGYDLDYYDYLREQKAEHIKHFSDRYDAYLVCGSKGGAVRPSKLKELDGHNYYNCWVLSGSFNDYVNYVRYICENTDAKKILLQISTSELFVYDRENFGTIYELPAEITGDSKFVETVNFLMKNPKTAVEELIEKPNVHPNRETGERELNYYYDFQRSLLPNDNYFKYMFSESYVYYKYFNKKLKGVNANGESCIAAMKEIKSICEKNDVEIQVYFAPLFAPQMIQYDTEAFYDLLEEAVMLFGDIWCFNNFSDVALCPYNFYNPAHFYYEVADMMVDVMAGKECPVKDFGQLLTRKNIGTVIEERRASLQRWKEYYEANYYPEYDYGGVHYETHNVLPFVGYDSEANLTKVK